MSARWQHKVIEVKARLFAGSIGDRAQVELDKMGAQGWQLVSVLQTSGADTMRLFFKKEA